VQLVAKDAARLVIEADEAVLYHVMDNDRCASPPPWSFASLAHRMSVSANVSDGGRLTTRVRVPAAPRHKVR
jgi:hypothetical protein